MVPEHSEPAGPRFQGDEEAAWREAERIVQEAADRITAAAGADPEQASDAAWAAADALAAAAAGLEGDDGGPLTDAAVAFDRLVETPSAECRSARTPDGPCGVSAGWWHARSVESAPEGAGSCFVGGNVVAGGGRR